jgi:adenine deaminase
MVANGKQTPFKFHWGVPSCVPATAFETAGATITSADVRELFEQDGLGYLSEMMNYPGVLHGDAEVMAKIRIARELGKPVDGHAPGLRGDEARRYAAAGITTDHECVTLEEALEKIAAGMHILIREGSAAKNFAALEPLLKSHPERCMFCSDDLHPDALVAGHVNRLVARAIAGGADLYDVLRVACINAVNHYGLPVGLLRVGDAADFILVDDVLELRVRQTWIDGHRVFSEHTLPMHTTKGPADASGVRFESTTTIRTRVTLPQMPCDAPNKFACEPIRTVQLRIRVGGSRVRVIGARDGQLVTDELLFDARMENGEVVADLERDVLKIVVVNRYAAAPPVVALIHGFGLQLGAIASSVAHDSHNIVAVGTNDDDLVGAINAVIECSGGLAVANGMEVESLPLEVAGLMSRDGDAVADGYARLDAAAKASGSPLTAPFMTLSFMALLVIPSLKLSDQGLFDGRTFEFVNLFA